MSSFDQLHKDRSRAGSFGSDAAQYDRSRPSYPPALLDDLVAPDVHAVLDVGCGTGIASRLFADRGCTVLGVEQDDRMAAVARSHGLDVDVAPFEQWTPRGAPFDLVVSAQAWHWIDPIAGPAKVASLLKPGGRFGAFWNMSVHQPDVAAAFTAAYEQHAPQLVTTTHMLGAVPSEWSDPPGATTFGDPDDFSAAQLRVYPWQRTYTRDEWLDQLPTHSDHRALPSDALAPLLGALADAIDELGGAITIDYTTGLLTALRRGVPS